MARTMPPKKDTPTNTRLFNLRSAAKLTQAKFGKKYFRVNLRTYQRYESTASHKDLPGPVQILIERMERDARLAK